MTPLPELGYPMRTSNRYALVSAIRHLLRRRGLGRTEIERFSREALSAQDAQMFERICRDWVQPKPEPV
jgi:hypothetical protein